MVKHLHQGVCARPANHLGLFPDNLPQRARPEHLQTWKDGGGEVQRPEEEALVVPPRMSVERTACTISTAVLLQTPCQGTVRLFVVQISYVPLRGLSRREKRPFLPDVN